MESVESQIVYVDMVSVGRLKTKISVDQFSEVFFNAFQDHFSYYPFDSREHANCNCKTGVLSRNLLDHPSLFPLTSEDLRFPYVTDVTDVSNTYTETAGPKCVTIFLFATVSL